MLAINIIQEIQRLPLTQKFLVVEETIKSIKNEEINHQMAFAVSELFDDYKNDEELTAFTNLDFLNFMKQSEIWLVDLDPTKGSEIQKKRPAVIVNDDTLGRLPLKLLFLLPTGKTDIPLHLG